jgi:hypothetical protein
MIGPPHLGRVFYMLTHQYVYPKLLCVKHLSYYITCYTICLYLLPGGIRSREIGLQFLHVYNLHALLGYIRGFEPRLCSWDFITCQNFCKHIHLLAFFDLSMVNYGFVQKICTSVRLYWIFAFQNESNCNIWVESLHAMAYVWV